MLRIICYIHFFIVHFTPCVNLTVDSLCLFIPVDADWFTFSRCEKLVNE